MFFDYVVLLHSAFHILIGKLPFLVLNGAYTQAVILTTAPNTSSQESILYNLGKKSTFAFLASNGTFYILRANIKHKIIPGFAG
jgi:hypothetical protein